MVVIPTLSVCNCLSLAELSWDYAKTIPPWAGVEGALRTSGDQVTPTETVGVR